MYKSDILSSIRTGFTKKALYFWKGKKYPLNIHSPEGESVYGTMDNDVQLKLLQERIKKYNASVDAYNQWRNLPDGLRAGKLAPVILDVPTTERWQTVRRGNVTLHRPVQYTSDVKGNQNLRISEDDGNHYARLLYKPMQEVLALNFEPVKRSKNRTVDTIGYSATDSNGLKVMIAPTVQVDKHGNPYFLKYELLPNGQLALVPLMNPGLQLNNILYRTRYTMLNYILMKNKPTDPDKEQIALLNFFLRLFAKKTAPGQTPKAKAVPLTPKLKAYYKSRIPVVLPDTRSLWERILDAISAYRPNIDPLDWAKYNMHIMSKKQSLLKEGLRFFSGNGSLYSNLRKVADWRTGIYTPNEVTATVDNPNIKTQLDLNSFFNLSDAATNAYTKARGAFNGIKQPTLSKPILANYGGDIDQYNAAMAEYNKQQADYKTQMYSAGAEYNRRMQPVARLLYSQGYAAPFLSSQQVASRGFDVNSIKMAPDMLYNGVNDHEDARRDEFVRSSLATQAHRKAMALNAKRINAADDSMQNSTLYQNTDGTTTNGAQRLELRAAAKDAVTTAQNDLDRFNAEYKAMAPGTSPAAQAQSPLTEDQRQKLRQDLDDAKAAEADVIDKQKQQTSIGISKETDGGAGWRQRARLTAAGAVDVDKIQSQAAAQYVKNNPKPTVKAPAQVDPAQFKHPTSLNMNIPVGGNTTGKAVAGTSGSSIPTGTRSQYSTGGVHVGDPDLGMPRANTAMPERADRRGVYVNPKDGKTYQSTVVPKSQLQANLAQGRANAIQKAKDKAVADVAHNLKPGQAMNFSNDTGKAKLTFVKSRGGPRGRMVAW